MQDTIRPGVTTLVTPEIRDPTMLTNALIHASRESTPPLAKKRYNPNNG
jgi:hypothetical protein